MDTEEIQNLFIMLEKYKYGLIEKERLLERIAFLIKSDSFALEQSVEKGREILANIENSLKQPFRIVFCGRFKTGKSSLINAILGTDILPIKAKRATAVNTCIKKKAFPWTFGESHEAIASITEKGKERNVSIREAQPPPTASRASS